MTTTTSTGEPVRLDDHVMGGPVLATAPGVDGRPLEVHRWMSWLRVRADERVGVLVQTRREWFDYGGPSTRCPISYR